jgi:hypothetical protein
MLLSARDGWPARYAGRMKRAAASPIPDGLDRTTLSQIERLTADEQ